MVETPLCKQVPVETDSIEPVDYVVLSEDTFSPDPDTRHLSSLLACLGYFQKHNRKILSFIQWLFVIFYAVLLILPLLSLYIGDVRLYSSVSDISLLVFWGLGWPMIILGMMLSGRVWCGLFCPDGTLTEFISHHGQKRSIPRWIRWKGWPCTVLVVAVLYGQLTGVYENFPATLILLGVPTVLSLITGFLYGNGKRIWCMYLCPGNGIFSLLSRLSPVYYKIDSEKWSRYSDKPERVDCPVLINIRHMKSMSACHACGRCIGYRNAVETGFRSPATEIMASSGNNIPHSDIFLLLWGVTGICTAALAWRGNPLYTRFISFLIPLDCMPAGDLPKWLAATPSSPFVPVFIFFAGSALALLMYSLLWLAARCSGQASLWKALALCLLPVSGFGMLLGLCKISLSLWHTHGFEWSWFPILQITVLSGAALFSIWLGIKAIPGQGSPGKLASILIYCLSVLMIYTIWVSYYLT